MTCLHAGISHSSVVVSQESQRVLIVTAGHDASLLSLYDYFTFRGYRVDCVERMDDARALVRHVFYHAIIASAVTEMLQSLDEFIYDVRSRHVGSRIFAVVAEGEREQMKRADVDAMFGRELPISQLARTLRHAMTGAPQAT